MGTWDTTMAGFENKDVILDGFVSICCVALRIHHWHFFLGGLEGTCKQLS